MHRFAQGKIKWTKKHSMWKKGQTDVEVSSCVVVISHLNFTRCKHRERRYNKMTPKEKVKSSTLWLEQETFVNNRKINDMKAKIFRSMDTQCDCHPTNRNAATNDSFDRMNNMLQIHLQHTSHLRTSMCHLILMVFKRIKQCVFCTGSSWTPALAELVTYLHQIQQRWSTQSEHIDGLVCGQRQKYGAEQNISCNTTGKNTD